MIYHQICFGFYPPLLTLFNKNSVKSLVVKGNSLQNWLSKVLNYLIWFNRRLLKMIRKNLWLCRTSLPWQGKSPLGLGVFRHRLGEKPLQGHWNVCNFASETKTSIHNINKVFTTLKLIRLMKKMILLLAVILGSLLMQSCFCEHDFWGPGPVVYGHPASPPPPPPHRHVFVWWSIMDIRYWLVYLVE